MKDLSFGELRETNVMRCEEVFHKVRDWTPTDWACALAGETGEACNFVKKLRRLDGSDLDFIASEQRAELRLNIGKELADVVIYADLLAARLDLDLGDFVRAKFNEISARMGSVRRL
ncbi:MAG TPA: hypothetical protein VHZ30_02020 [Verrucomicrobiae bacterium]|nr:hypothetical protein [Verrucomicrobiae bacterium]